MSNNDKLISIIVPVYNEEGNLAHFYDELTASIGTLRYDFEIIFVDDNSRDRSVLILKKFAAKDHRISIVQLSRNFGKEVSLSAGLHRAKGAAAIMIDADLQMPPRLIGKFLKHWEKGSEVVIGVFSERNMSTMHALGSKLFYRIMSTISHTKVVPHATDFRLIDREVIDAFNRLGERNRITRGLIDWMGFERSYIHFKQDPRLHGEPTYTYRKLIRLAVNSFTAFSMLPLKFAGYLGVFILFISAPVGIYMYLIKFVFRTPFGIDIRGTAFVAVLLLFLVGVVLSSLGLIALYIARIYDEALGRP